MTQPNLANLFCSTLLAVAIFSVKSHVLVLCYKLLESLLLLLLMHYTKHRNNNQQIWHENLVQRSNCLGQKLTLLVFYCWTFDLERKLADILRIEHNLGYNANGGWKMFAYYNASSKLSSQFHIDINVVNVKIYLTFKIRKRLLNCQ